MTVKYQTFQLPMARRMPDGPSVLRTSSSASMTLSSARFSSLSSHFAFCGLSMRKKMAAMPATTAIMPSVKNITCQPRQGV